MNTKNIEINARYYLSHQGHRLQPNSFDVIDRALLLQFKPAVIFSNGTEAECRDWVLRNCEEPVEHTKGEWAIRQANDGQRFYIESDCDSRALQEWRKKHPGTDSFRGVSICHASVHYNGSGEKFGPLIILDKQEAEANAALLKTAPKLLALVEQYHQSFPSKDSGRLICEAKGWTIQE